MPATMRRAAAADHPQSADISVLKVLIMTKALIFMENAGRVDGMRGLVCSRVNAGIAVLAR